MKNTAGLPSGWGAQPQSASDSNTKNRKSRDLLPKFIRFLTIFIH